ncbi:recD protein [Lactobacillus selangorensis]|uniref:ATP-dependent RecD2 DNA helicase n=1 Tax=Lactobacillus selangorensis TaxID=81857 RepID=A0A0R2G9Z4_9LACO|nr:ATP-dependent RecD-like DNA helicase [Lactobacillus selangorensis]KRN29381.1 recD protein [Lactobacillus selangorensis]KRN34090.1 recD protein [Lactobacillus selangorensis]
MNNEEQHFITGQVERIFFQNDTTLYKVLLVKIDKTDIKWNEDEITVTGSFGTIKEEGSYTFFGDIKTHPKYGPQFQATNYQSDQPTTKSGLVAYLSGEQFTGIGKMTAEKIVTALGGDAIDKIIADPSVLVPLGINAKKRKTLVDVLTENNGMEQIIIGLNDYGFGSTLAYAIYQHYQEDTLRVLRENPYQLILDIDGVGFKRADQIAEKIGIADDADIRLRGALLEELNQLTQQEGDTYTAAEPLLNGALNLLQQTRRTPVAPQKVADQILALAHDGKIMSEDDRIYPRSLFNAEWQIAQELYRIEKEYADKQAASLKHFETELKHVEKRLKITYDDSQKQAIKAALQHHVFLLTGGPGTGKTTVINGLVALFAQLHHLSLDINEYKEETFPILLAAPTGRAAKRMTETTGLPASTIHRLLGLTGRENDPDTPTKELEGGLLIIDEMSMVDTYLFRSLVRAIPSDMQVVLVGDKDQLPSVGPGQVFSDLLAAQILPEIELNQIYRQNDDSSIIELAHDINTGQVPANFFTNQSDRSFIACNAYQVPDVIDQVVTHAKQKGFETSDIQVLAPMYRGAAGIDRLNPMIQEIMNPRKNERTKEVKTQNGVYRIGDKVLHLVNSPDVNVFNGEIGQIVGITEAKKSKHKSDELTIAFEGNEVTYKRSDWYKITLAYCTSIHKAQGSEFQMVILPLVHQEHRMLKRNLLYTAVTRAKQFLILIGEREAFETAVKEQSANRKTTLKERLKQVFEQSQTMPHQAARQLRSTAEAAVAPSEIPVASDDDTTATTATTLELHEDEDDYRLTVAKVASGEIDPMIGMGTVTPRSFM